MTEDARDTDSLARARLASPRRGASLERARLGDGVREFLVFSLGDQHLGLPLASVQEILKLTPVTEVPRAKHDVLGILSVRGRLTTVLDLRRRLSMPEMRPTRLTRILLVDGGKETLGLRVDQVLHVVRLRDDEIEARDVIASDLPDHVTGLGRPRRAHDEGAAEIVVLLDPIMLLRVD